MLHFHPLSPWFHTPLFFIWITSNWNSYEPGVLDAMTCMWCSNPEYTHIELHTDPLLNKQVSRLCRKKRRLWECQQTQVSGVCDSVFHRGGAVQTNYTGCLSLQICAHRRRQHKPSLETSNLVHEHTLTWRGSIMYPKDPQSQGVAL